MIGSLTGTIQSSTKNPLLLDVHDVGYLVHVPPRISAKHTVGAHITLAIHTHVREDSFELYGFESQEELTVFELLLTVSGIGPKTALLVIDRGVTSVKHAIERSDVSFFTSIPRLGKKNAQKIIIELSQKLGSMRDLDLTQNSTTDELLDALLTMGFTKQEGMKAIRKISNTEASLDIQLREVLRYLGK